MQAVGLEDFLLLAEVVTGIRADGLLQIGHLIARAESALAAPVAAFDDFEPYEGLAAKAAVLCSRLLRDHPLPDGNKRVAYLCMIEPIRRNGAEWAPTASEQQRVSVIERLAARDMTEQDFVRWVERQVVSPRKPEPRRTHT